MDHFSTTPRKEGFIEQFTAPAGKRKEDVPIRQSFIMKSIASGMKCSTMSLLRMHIFQEENRRNNQYCPFISKEYSSCEVTPLFLSPND